MYRIINIVDNLGKVNFGIWNAAIATAGYLKRAHGMESEIWFPALDPMPELPEEVVAVPIDDLSTLSVGQMIRQRNLSPSNCVVVTHGCWRYPTRWGAAFKDKGFKWVYVPHGMLEPWSMEQKRWKKLLYGLVREFPLSRKADAIRAVSEPEQENLQKRYGDVWHNANGLEAMGDSCGQWDNIEPLSYLFMARLHHKKGVVPLIKAWMKSPQFNHPGHHLFLAGPDDGEQSEVESLLALAPQSNVTLLGGVYGDAKVKLLKQSHVYLLPSFSEGFPTSVLEAMAAGIVTVITKGCNFPEAIKSGKALETTPNEGDILKVLNRIWASSPESLSQMAREASGWVMAQYSLKHIAEQQARFYRQLLPMGCD